MEAGGALAEQLQATMAAGGLVDDSAMLDMLYRAAADADADVVLVDGFPRCLTQAPPPPPLPAGAVSQGFLARSHNLACVPRRDVLQVLGGVNAGCIWSPQHRNRHKECNCELAFVALKELPASLQETQSIIAVSSVRLHLSTINHEQR